IRPAADEEEIRKAHRRLVRLMHPDQHRDPAMKQLAETQMRRLNSIVATLLDDERRQEYDQQLRASLTARPVVQTAWRNVPWWIGSTVGAVVLTVGAVWFWADHLGSSFNSRQPVEITPDSTAVRQPAGKLASQPDRPPTTAAKARPEPPPRIVATVIPSAPAADRWRGVVENPKSTKSNPRTMQFVSRTAKPKAFTLPAGTRSIPAQAIAPKSQAQSAPPPPPPGANAGTATHEEIASLTLPTLPVAMAPKPEPVFTGASIPAEALHPATRGDLAVGEWVYSPKEPERHKPGFYPPAFISLKLSRNDRGLRGQYKARYEVTDNKPISPDVSFQLTAVDKASRKFVWEASNGSRGTLAIRSIDGRTMRLEWRTTVFTGGPALTSGIATLERREP
ncbi:MAG: DnaJ domain-containing protein, partial [Bryobacteraceae bacterium]